MGASVSLRIGIRGPQSRQVLWPVESGTLPALQAVGCGVRMRVREASVGCGVPAGRNDTREQDRRGVCGWAVRVSE
jgi:hypothetical protein